MMQWPSNNSSAVQYWLRVYGWYALAEAGIQLILYTILNNFGSQPISNVPFHTVMWSAQCLLICPVWIIAFSIIRLSIGWQVLMHLILFVLYSIFWFGPVQHVIIEVYQPFQQWMLPPEQQLVAYVDSLDNIDFAPYQVLKYAFRLGWFYLAYFHISFQKEEAKKLELATSNQALQVNLLKWQLNATFYENTLAYLQGLAQQHVQACAKPILQLSKIMEYIIYDAQVKIISLTREADFMLNYIDLINQQAEILVKWKFELSDLSAKASITPLLLAEIMENISAMMPVQRSATILLQLNCTTESICFSATHPFLGIKKVDITLKAALNEILKIKYSNKFEYFQDKEKGSITIRLPLQPIEGAIKVLQLEHFSKVKHASS